MLLMITLDMILIILLVRLLIAVISVVSSDNYRYYVKLLRCAFVVGILNGIKMHSASLRHLGARLLGQRFGQILCRLRLAGTSLRGPGADVGFGLRASFQRLLGCGQARPVHLPGSGLRAAKGSLGCNRPPNRGGSASL